MRKILQSTLLTLSLLLVYTTAFGQVRINEIGLAGVDFEGASKWVELYNAGDTDVDVSNYWLCNFPAYNEISSLSVLEGQMVIPPDGYLVVVFSALGDADGEVGLYSTNASNFTGDMLDYMEYGSGGHTRESVAVTAGLWEASAFAETPASGSSLFFTGAGATQPESWATGTASPGAFNGVDHATAERAMIDRFSTDAGNLFVRDEANGLPEANAPINFDQGPFITQGFGPAGEIVRYYNFDAQPTAPAPIYVLFAEGSDTPVPGQFNIVDVIPGDENYNDFWQPFKVTVPAGYVANTFTSADQLAGLVMEALDVIVNCPIVPEGSSASMRMNVENTSSLVNGWYKGLAVFYFEFGEAALAPVNGAVPLSPIYVSFNINPGQDGGGPPSGFLTEVNSDQTHNVVATVPGDETYSPLWVVNIFDNAAFDAVGDLATAQAATILVAGAALVNCPVVNVEGNVAIQELDEVPGGFVLHGNYPNPFNPTTTIKYELNEAGQVALEVYNMLGQRVAQLLNTVQQAGVYQVDWDGHDSEGRIAASGIYLYRLTLDQRDSVSRVMTLLK